MAETIKLGTPEFAKLVKLHQKPESIDHGAYSVATMGSSLLVRKRGGFIMQCSLTPEGSSERRDIFYCQPDKLLTPKLRASHLMMPVGPYKGPGGQHGPLRWVDYDGEAWNSEAYRVERDFGLGVMQLRPTHRDENGLRVGLNYHLWDDRLRRLVNFSNFTGATIRTSLGFHDYLRLPEGGDPLRINDQTLNELLGDEGAEAAVMKDEARLWRGFDGAATVQMPDGSALRLSGKAWTGSDHPDNHPTQQYPIGMLIWSQPDERGANPFICLEPVIGVEDPEPGRNEGLELFNRHDGTFDYTLQAL